jgi:hypothetical protein
MTTETLSAWLAINSDQERKKRKAAIHFALHGRYHVEHNNINNNVYNTGRALSISTVFF